jgi:hypothetical protein
MKTIEPTKELNLNIDDVEADELELPEQQAKTSLNISDEVKEFALIELGSLKIQLGSCSIHSFLLAKKVMEMYDLIKKDNGTKSNTTYTG